MAFQSSHKSVHIDWYWVRAVTDFTDKLLPGTGGVVEGLRTTLQQHVVVADLVCLIVVELRPTVGTDAEPDEPHSCSAIFT